MCKKHNMKKLCYLLCRRYYFRKYCLIYYMKRLVLVFFVGLVLTSSCRKVIEDTKKSFVLDVITNGQWYVSSYDEAGTVITSQFSGYTFQFFEDERIIAYKGASSQQGTWTGNIADYSITSSFTDAVDPVNKLNGTWVLKDSGDDFVVAERQTDQGLMKLRLEKVQ